MLSVPFALVGGVWLMWWLGYNMSVAVAVGFIALAGVAAETGVVMLIYLDHAWEEASSETCAEGREPTAAISTRRSWKARSSACGPKMMTVVAIMAGLLPIMWSTGTGSEVMSRIAAPMVGGMVSSTVLTLVVIPALYALVKQWSRLATQLPRLAQAGLAVHPRQPGRPADLHARPRLRPGRHAAEHRRPALRRLPRRRHGLRLDDERSDLRGAVFVLLAHACAEDLGRHPQHAARPDRCRRRRTVLGGDQVLLLRLRHPRRHHRPRPDQRPAGACGRCRPSSSPAWPSPRSA
jgi:hypothetical protein